MKNLKIQAKLLVGFGLVLVMVILLGTISITRMNVLNKTTQGFATVTVPALDDIWMTRRNMVSMERYLLQIIGSCDITDVADSDKNITTDRTNLMNSLDALVALIPEYKATVDKIKGYVEQNATVRKQIVELASKLTPEDNQKAYEIYTAQYTPVFDLAAKEIISLYNDVNTRIAARVTDANATASSSFITVLSVMAVVVILTVVMTYLITKSIVTPVKQLETVASRMTNGDFNVSINYQSKDELGVLIRSFASLRDIIFMLINRINKMADELDKGDTDARVPQDEFKGEYQNMANAINKAVAGLVDNNLTVMNGFSKFGEGDFKANLPKFPGKKAIANKYFDELKDNLSSVSGDVNRLIAAAIDGKLDTRVDASAYNGDWNTLIQGLNNLLQAVSTPINEANAVLAQLSKGDFNVSINKNYKGSFAEMTNSFDAMVTAIGSYINEITQTLATLSSGDLRANIGREYLGQFNMIKESINHISKTLRATMGDIRVSADNVLSGAKQISESAMSLANGASIQASSVEELNASVLSINDKTHRTAKDAQYADDLSKKSMENAKDGNVEMNKMLTSMLEIKEASANISKIMKVIDDIAFQTNLLALNAAVEAARAGEHGKGFAVVAEEVRSLAGRSQRASKETSVMIEDIISKINDGTSTAQLTAKSLQQIVSDISLVSDTITNIYTAAKDQSEGISQITIGIDQISEVVQRNASTSEESAAAAEELNSQSEVLAQMVSGFVV